MLHFERSGTETTGAVFGEGFCACTMLVLPIAMLRANYETFLFHCGVLLGRRAFSAFTYPDTAVGPLVQTDSR